MVALERAFTRWAHSVLEALTGESEGIAVDGKTLRGARKQGAVETHLLSAVAHTLGLVVAQLPVADQTNEQCALAPLLAELVLTGRVLTADALHTQPATAQRVLAQGGDYPFGGGQLHHFQLDAVGGGCFRCALARVALIDIGELDTFARLQLYEFR